MASHSEQPTATSREYAYSFSENLTIGNVRISLNSWIIFHSAESPPAIHLPTPQESTCRASLSRSASKPKQPQAYLSHDSGDFLHLHGTTLDNGAARNRSECHVPEMTRLAIAGILAVISASNSRASQEGERRYGTDGTGVVRQVPWYLYLNLLA